MKIKNIFSIVSLIVLLFVVSGCSKEDKTDSSSAEQQGVTIENFGVTTTYTSIPERIVPLSYATAQTLVALGLEDKIVGLATAEGDYGDCLPEYQDALSKIKVIVEGTPSFEVLLAENPDFVYATVYTFGKHGVAPVEDFQRENINFYCLNGTCSGKPSFEDEYKDLEDLGKIFKKEKEAAGLIKKLKAREAALRNSPVEKKLKVMGYDSSYKGSLFVAGRGIESEIIKLAGGKNIFDDLERAFGKMSVEEVAVRNPDIILVHQYDTGDTSGTVEEKINELKNDPVLADVTAVKNDNFVVVKLIEVFPGLQVYDAAERLHEKIKEIN